MATSAVDKTCPTTFLACRVVSTLFEVAASQFCGLHRVFLRFNRAERAQSREVVPLFDVSVEAHGPVLSGIGSELERRIIRCI